MTHSASALASAASLSSIGQVFETILTNGPLCRRDVAELTGLSQGSVTKLAKPMIDAGYLVETQPVSAGPGRPMVPLEVVADRQFAIGIKVMASELVAVMIDMSAAIRASQRFPVDGHDVGAVLAAIGEATATLPRAVRGAPSRVVGVGIGVGGHVDRVNGAVRYSPGLHWPSIDLAQRIQRTAGMPVVVENDANALALYEQWFGAGRGWHSFAIVTIGAGIGCGLVLNGELYTGATGAAGEFGHLVVVADGPLCSCGRRGCLEAVVGDEALVAAVASAVGRPVASSEEAYRLAADGSTAAREAFRRAGSALGHGLATMVNLLNLQLIILSGEGVSRVAATMDAVRERLAAEAFSSAAQDCRLLVRPLPDETWAAGAAASMLRAGVLESLDRLVEAN